MEHDHARPRSYAEELELSRKLLEQGDRLHALHHCVGALTLEPHRREWSPTLRELLEHRDVVQKLEGDTFYGSRAALAFHQRERGNLTEAFDSIAPVIEAAPNLGFQRWFVTWLGDAGAVASASAVKRVLALVTTFGLGRIRLLPAERAAAEELVPIADYAIRSLSEPRVLWLAAATYRRAGRCEKAIEAAAKARPGLPPDLGGTALGLSLRANREFDLACKVFDETFAATGGRDFLHEKLRVLADAGRWNDALSIFERLGTEGLDPENQGELAELRTRLASNAPAPEVPPFDIVRRRAVGHGTLAPMLDATANGLRQYKEKQSAANPTELGKLIRGDSATVAISGNEGASNRLCMALMFSGEPDPRRAKYSIATGSALQTVADRVDQYSLWKLDGDIVVQALPAPSTAVADWIEQVALHEPDGAAPETLLDAGGDFLDMWTFSKTQPNVEAGAREWVAATTYPRMPLFRVAMGPDWVYRWQVASLIGLAHSESGWDGSHRRDAFWSLLDGAIDWPLAAAIRVLAEIALDEPDTTSEIRSRLIRLSETLGNVPNLMIPLTLLNALEAIPFVPEHHVSALRSRLKQDAAEVTDDDDTDASAPEPPSVKRPWWKFWG
jgi:tetratricopeptide (TPR) repeat protein